MKKIVTYLIDRPLITNLIMVLIVVFALVSVGNIKRLAFPRVDMKQMNITTIYPGASPEDVELNVSVKLEEALKEVDGIEKFKSTSLENRSIIKVTIEPNVEDLEKTKNDIRRAVESVSDLPEEVTIKPKVFEIKVDNLPIYEVVLASPDVGTKLIRHHARELKKRLLKLSTISKVKEQGVPDREIKILLDREKMAKKFISFDEVINSIKNNKIRVSGGSLESYTSKRGIITLSEFDNPKDVEKIIIRASDLGYIVRVKDVAEVVDGFEEQDTLIRFNGKRGMSLWISKKGQADIIDSVIEIKKEIETYKNENLPAEIKSFSTFDASIETKARLNMVYSNAIIGYFLVLLVLFLFLDKKIAFWTATGIPLSVAIALIILPIFDITLNGISLMGLVVVLGMLVDDAIIIAESIYSNREAGMPAKEAAIRGLQDVLKPVIATILTTILAFIPMYFLPGQIGDFSLEIPSIVIIMLLSSLVEATTLLPAHLAHSKTREGKTNKPPLGQSILYKIETFYRNLLNWCLNNIFKTSLLFLLFIIIGGGFAINLAKFKMFPIDQATKMWIYGETSSDSSLKNTARETKKIESILTKLPKGIVHSYKSVNGVKFTPGGNNDMLSSNGFFIEIHLTPASERELSATDLKKNILSQVKEFETQPFYKLDYYIDGGGPPAGKPLEIRITGNNETVIKKILKQVNTQLKKYPVTDVDSNFREGKIETRLIPKYINIAEAGLNVGVIASNIRTAFDGTIVTYLQTPEEKVPFRVMLDEKSKNFKDPLKGILIRNKRDILVSISQLVESKDSSSPENIYHYNGSRSYTITANLDSAKTTPKEIYDRLKDKFIYLEKQNPGFSIEFGGEAQKDSETMHDMLLAILMAVLAIYFLLIIQFNSFSQPAMVLMAIPFGLVGAILAFGLQSMDLSMLALIGILGFSGVVINDSLILVEFINRIREKSSKQLFDKKIFINEVIDGSAKRLRPILLTTFTTVAGLIPTAYGFIGGFDSFISPMVMAMTWGLLVGTISVLFIIPVFYVLNEQIGNSVAKYWDNIFKKN